MLRSLRRSILKNQLTIRGVEKINKKFHDFWRQIRIKEIKLMQKKGIYRKDKDPYIIYVLKKRQGQGKAKQIQAVY